MEKHASEQEIAHVHHLLSLSEAKSRDLSDSLRLHQSKDYPSKIARLEAELAHTEHASVALQNENDELKKKYQEFGAQVEAFMNEQAEEKAAVLKTGDERVKLAQAQIDAVRQQGQDALKAKQSDLVRLADQLKLRQDALAKAEQKVSVLEDRLKAAEVQVSDEKLRSANQVSKLEKDVAHWKNQVEKERVKGQAAEKSAADLAAKYEAQIVRLQESFEKQTLQSAKEKETEARTRWQNDFAAKQEARVEALKAKYDAALENQQTELLRARQQALDSAAAITAKYEAGKRSQRENDELDKQRRAEAAAREKAARDDERSRDIAHKRMQSELDEREKRLLERERFLLEKERSEERKRAEAAHRNAAASSSAAPAAPSVVVLNMQSPDDANQQEQKRPSRNVLGVVNKTAARRSEPREESSSLDGDSISKAQHHAELQAREAQILLQSEEKLQAALLEAQGRKEKEFRAAMVNVRKGIQKLESAVEDARKEKSRVEQEMLSERQAFVALKQELDGAKEAKITVVQRLEEANDNIGKLRSLVKEYEKKCRRLEDQAKRAQEQESKSVANASESQAELAVLKSELVALEKLKQQSDGDLESARDDREKLQIQVRALEGDLERCRDELAAEKDAITERATTEVSSAASRFESLLKHLQAKEAETRNLLVAEEAKVSHLEGEILELRQHRSTQESTVQQMKLDNSQQRKEFNNLARIHKNLVETMDRRVGDEVAERQKVESLLHAVEKDINDVKLHKQRVLLVYKMHLSKLKKDVLDMRRSVKSEMKLSLKQLENEFLALGGSFEKQAAKELETRIGEYQRQIESERAKSEAQLQRKEQEMSGMFGSQRVSDRAKYELVLQQLDAKTQELRDLEAQLASEKATHTTLQLAVHRLEGDVARYEMEQSRLREQLSSSKVSSERESSERERDRTMLERHSRMSQVFLSFVVSLIKAHRLNAPGILSREIDVSWQEKSDEQQLASELDQVAKLLYEEGQQAIAKARDEGAASLTGELDTAKRALQSLWGRAETSDDDVFQQHLPWYLSANRALKQLQDDADRTCSSLKNEVAAKDARIQELYQRKMKLQEANNVLRFEKETIAREMSMLSQSLTKKREQEIEDVRLDCERKIEQMKHTHETDRMKADQEHQVRYAAAQCGSLATRTQSLFRLLCVFVCQITIEQLRSSLDAERRSYTNLKNQSTTYVRCVQRAALDDVALSDLCVSIATGGGEDPRGAQGQDHSAGERSRRDPGRGALLVLLAPSCVCRCRRSPVASDRVQAVRWKRKAKLAVKSTTSSVGANTPTRAHFLQSASSHGTENDSDTSFRLVFPPPLTPRTPRTPLSLRMPRTPRTPRRPSSAIADLSSLMEESLDNLQKKDSTEAREPFQFG